MLRAALELAGDGQWRPSFARLRAASVRMRGPGTFLQSELLEALSTSRLITWRPWLHICNVHVDFHMSKSQCEAMCLCSKSHLC